MRWIFFCLLSINIALAGWRALVGEPASLALEQHGETNRAASQIISRLRLLHEPSQSMTASHRVSPNASHAKSASQVQALQCVAVGPFKSKAVAEDFLASLTSLDVVAHLDIREVMDGASYWVHLPPEKGREAARRKLVGLQGRGIESYIIPDGVLHNGISLGVFSRLELAEARQAALSVEGLSTKIHTMKRQSQELWVVLGHAEEHKITEKIWNELLTENNSARQQENFCLDVASEENFH